MALARLVLLTLLLISAIASTGIAHAQFVSINPYSVNVTYVKDPVTGKIIIVIHRVSTLGFYPYSHFDQDREHYPDVGFLNGLAESVSTKVTGDGLLFAADTLAPAGSGYFGFGGWYWRPYSGTETVTSSDIRSSTTTTIDKTPDYQILDLHVKYYPVKVVGFQLGDRLPTDRSFNESIEDAYVLLDPMHTSTNPGRSITAQVGLGAYYKNGYSEQLTFYNQPYNFSLASHLGFSGFVAASAGISGHTSINVSYWYETGQGGYNRFAAGMGYWF